MTVTREAFAVLAIGAVASIAGCSGHAPGGSNAVNESSRNAAESGTGTVGMQLTLPDGETLDQADYTLTDGNGTVVRSGATGASLNRIGFLLGEIPPGPGYVLAIQASAHDGGTACVGTSAPFVVVAQATIAVNIPLQCTVAAPDAGNAGGSVAPYFCATWTSLAADPTQGAVVGAVVTLSATASGGDPAHLAYSWSASNGIGTFGANAPNGTSDTTTFTCATAGTATISLVVSDGPIADGGSCSASASTVTMQLSCSAPPADGGTAGATEDATSDAPADAPATTDAPADSPTDG